MADPRETSGTPLGVRFLSFSMQFSAKILRNNRFYKHLWDYRPRLGNPGNVNVTKQMHFSQTQLVAKYGVLIRECGGLYYAFLEVSMNKIAL